MPVSAQWVSLEILNQVGLMRGTEECCIESLCTLVNLRAMWLEKAMKSGIS